jgi:metal-responsive CopG/Arc/MetJ family transcriptional regulator
MKNLIDPCQKLEMKVQSVTLTTEDLERLDQIMEGSGFKNRSAAIRACILFVYNNSQKKGK